jgi:hypothetical protein
MANDDDMETYDPYEDAANFYNIYFEEMQTIDDDGKLIIMEELEEAFSEIAEFGHMADPTGFVEALLYDIDFDIDDIDIDGILEALYEYAAG